MKPDRLLIALIASNPVLYFLVMLVVCGLALFLPLYMIFTMLSQTAKLCLFWGAFAVFVGVLIFLLIREIRKPDPEYWKKLEEELRRRREIDKAKELQDAEAYASLLPEPYATALVSGKKAEQEEDFQQAFAHYQEVAEAGYFIGMYYLVLSFEETGDYAQMLMWTEKALETTDDLESEEVSCLFFELRILVLDRTEEDPEYRLASDEESVRAESILLKYVNAGSQSAKEHYDYVIKFRADKLLEKHTKQ